MSLEIAQLQAALAGRYKVERELGAGGMARVYLASDLRHQRHVAIKVLRPEIASIIGTERFLREIEIAAGLTHPHILPVYDSGEADGLLYYVMPYVEGQSLRQYMDEHGRLAIDEALLISGQIAMALDFAHDAGVIHRDIKPANILLIAGQAVVADFGVARAVNAARGAEITETGIVLGTPAYMSPEQAKGDARIDRRSDIYALGSVTFEMLTGHRPYQGRSAEEVLGQVIEDPIPSIRRSAPGIPDQIACAITCALAKDPEERFKTAGAFAEALAGRRRVPQSLKVRRRRRNGLIAAAVSVLVVAAAAIFTLTPRGTAASTAAPGTVGVAVLPFTVRGNPEVSYLGLGMVDLLSTALDGAGSWRRVDPRAVLGLMNQRGVTTADLNVGRRIAEGLDAGVYVLGNIVAAGGRVRIDASLYDRAQNGLAVASATAEGTPEEIFELVDDVAGQLLAGQPGVRDTRLAQTALVTTNSIPALKSYLSGMQAFRASRYVEAEQDFSKALQADSTFALAWYQMAVTADWLLERDMGRVAAERAVQYADRLAPRDRKLLEALLAVRQGNMVEAERLYRAFLGSYPDDIEAWFQLGEIQVHYGPTVGEPIDRSREAYDRVLALDPDQVSPYIHLARVEASEGNFGALDSAVENVLAAGPGGARDLEMITLRAFASGTAERRRQALDRVDAEASDNDLAEVVWSPTTYLHDPEVGTELARLMVKRTRSAEARSLGHTWLAYLAVARGQWRLAGLHLDEVYQLRPAMALEHRAILTLAPFADRPEAELLQVRDALRSLNPTTAQSSSFTSSFYTVHDGLHQYLRLYLLGLLSARLGDLAAAEAQVISLEALPVPPGSGSLVADMARGVRAAIAEASGDGPRALALWESVEIATWYQLSTPSPFYAALHQRYRRAQALARAGRSDEAIHWFGSFKDLSVTDLAYTGPAELESAELYERAGEVDSAIASYSRFAELWAQADEQYQPLVVRARDRIAALIASQG